MAVLYVFGGLLALILIICLIPASLHIRYENGAFRAFAKILGIIRIKLYPEDEKKAKGQKEEPEAQPSGQEQPQESKKTPTIDEIMSYISPGSHAARFVLNHMSVRNIVIIHIVRGYEPKQIGMHTGEAWGAFGALTAALKNTFGKVVFKRVEIVPDFADEYADNEKYCCKLCAITGIMIAALIIFFIKKDKEKREAANNEAEETTNG